MSPILLWAFALRAAIVDRICARWARNGTLADLLEPHTSYRPSLYPSRSATAQEAAELAALVAAYNAAQTLRGDPRRAHLGEASWWSEVGAPVPPELQPQRHVAQRRAAARRRAP